MAKPIGVVIVWVSSVVSIWYAIAITGSDMGKVPAATQVSTLAIFALVAVVSLAIIAMVEIFDKMNEEDE